MNAAAPSFEPIAQRIADDFRERHLPPDVYERQLVSAIVEALRISWNARGAADIAKLNESLLTGNVPKVVDALQGLDR